MAKMFDKGLNHFTTAVVGKNFTNDASYMMGYWEAGDILVDTAIKQINPLKDRLFFPICYNYRHFIELCLKHLILKAERLYYILEENNMQNKNLAQKFSDEIVYSISKVPLVHESRSTCPRKQIQHSIAEIHLNRPH